MNKIINKIILRKRDCFCAFEANTVHYSDRLFRCTSKLTGLWEGNSPVTGEFSAPMASKAANVSIGWHHHGLLMFHLGMWTFAGKAMIIFGSGHMHGTWSAPSHYLNQIWCIIHWATGIILYRNLNSKPIILNVYWKSAKCQHFVQPHATTVLGPSYVSKINCCDADRSDPADSILS